MSSIVIYTDFKSPQAYLALGPTLALAEQRGVAIEWRPYITRQPRIESERDDETRGETHVRVRQQQRHATCLRYAAVQGIPMTFPAEPGVSDCALAALLSIRPDPKKYIEAAFLAYWRDGRDLDDASVVRELLSDAGYNAQQFDEASARAELARAQAIAEENGIFDTPIYLVEGEMFLGREQLPWIESLLH